MFRKILIIIFINLIDISIANAKEINIDVNGLVCEFCAVTIEKNFKKREEVQEVKVDLEQKKVFLTFKKHQNLGYEEIIEVIKNNGYNAVKINRDEN